ncbi:hypothetical protein [Shewanella algae]|uniref:capsular polysaccharide export protein, LipB/KpsS family n=1 Tax=Shewanella algae TaxID=38313 RepID=UPI001AAC7D16|nr:hypothetical protein [Shewanella algae]QTE80941.1 hypothetical protein JKK46_14770 [Shewanella algae]
MFLFVTPSFDEFNFFDEVCKRANLKEFAILSTDQRCKGRNHLLYIDLNCSEYKKRLEVSTDFLIDDFLDYYGMSASEVIDVDRILKNNNFAVLNPVYVICYILSSISDYIQSNDVRVIYTGCGPELVRLVSYYLAHKYSLKIYMHAYYGKRNRVVYFRDPVSYYLNKVDKNDDFDIQGFEKLEPEYLNKPWHEDIKAYFQKLNNFNFSSFNRISNVVEAFCERRTRNVRYKRLLKNGVYIGIDDISKIKNRKILIPLHLFDDFVLTVLNRKFLNQIKVLKELSNSLYNSGITLIVKEHPADISGYNDCIYQELIMSGNLYFCDPYLDSTSVLNECDVLATFCSTYAIEAMYNQKPVILMGKSFYKQFEFCYELECVADIINLMGEIDSFSYDEKLKNFHYAIKELDSNSFLAPLPYLDDSKSAIPMYADIIKYISSHER